MILIADSGSTKTDWRLVDGTECANAETKGLNPFQLSAEQIFNILQTELLAQLPQVDAREITSVFFYGAGCIGEMVASMRACLKRVFVNADVEVESDLLGAARAACGHTSGVVAILGTGSNSCLFDGEKIVSQVPPLGFILGDEGSGAVLGKLFLNALLKNRLDEALKKQFFDEFQLSYTEIIGRVYRDPMPSRFLASLVPFIEKNISHKSVRDLVTENFRNFFENNILQYDSNVKEISLIGGMASSFLDEFNEVANSYGFRLKKHLRRPIDELVVYHTR